MGLPTLLHLDHKARYTVAVHGTMRRKWREAAMKTSEVAANSERKHEQRKGSFYIHSLHTFLDVTMDAADATKSQHFPRYSLIRSVPRS